MGTTPRARPPVPLFDNTTVAAPMPPALYAADNVDDAMDIDDHPPNPPTTPVPAGRPAPFRLGQPAQFRRPTLASDPDWYGQQPQSNICKRCEEQNEYNCLLKYNGFPCSTCERAGVVCQEGALLNHVQAKAVNDRGKARAARDDPKDKGKGRARPTRATRADPKDKGKGRATRDRSASPDATNLPPCNNCKKAGRRCGDDLTYVVLCPYRNIC